MPVRVITAPIIPGLNDTEIPAILAAAKEAGARAASYTLLRLPLTVAPVFREWLERTQPDRAERVLNLIRSTREGKLNEAEFGSRLRGKGEVAEQIGKLFRVFRAKHGLVCPLPDFDFSQFRPPQVPGGQMKLF